MTQDELKKAVGWAALQYVQPGTIVGVGTGSTAAHFIDALGTMKGQIEGAVSSSDASTEKLKSLGIHVFDLNEVDSLGIYVDGADEINGHMQMIKGGGAALTREKISASVAEKFICIADASKQVDILGKFPLPVEVIPMARSAVARQLVKLGGRPEYRQGVVTDNGNVILDVHGMEILDPIAMENAINAIPGVVTVGLFANRGADVALIGTPDGVKTIVKGSDGGTSPVKKILFIKFGDMCHAFTRQLSIALNKSSKPAYSSKNYLCVIFPQHRDANVHIAAILFFDMLKGGCKSAHNISKDRIG